MLQNRPEKGVMKPSTLDLIYTNEEDMVQNFKIDAPGGKSDHAVLNFDLICHIASKTPHIQTFYQKGNYIKSLKYKNREVKKKHFQIAILRKLVEVFTCPRCHFKED